MKRIFCLRRNFFLKYKNSFSFHFSVVRVLFYVPLRVATLALKKLVAPVFLRYHHRIVTAAAWALDKLLGVFLKVSLKLILRRHGLKY